LEREIHRRFAHLHDRGEWFGINRELVEWLEANTEFWYFNLSGFGPEAGPMPDGDRPVAREMDERAVVARKVRREQRRQEEEEAIKLLQEGRRKRLPVTHPRHPDYLPAIIKPEAIKFKPKPLAKPKPKAKPEPKSIGPKLAALRAMSPEQRKADRLRRILPVTHPSHPDFIRNG
jgi:hypothetical protein